MEVVWKINGFNIITVVLMILWSVLNWIVVQRIKWNDMQHLENKFKEHCDANKDDLEKIEMTNKEGFGKIEKGLEKLEKQNRDDHKKIFATQEAHEGRISKIEGRLNAKKR